MTDFTEIFEDYAQESAAPPVYLVSGQDWVGVYDTVPAPPDTTTPAASLPRGATMKVLQLPLDGQTLSKEIRVVKPWTTPRVLGSTMLTFSQLEDIPGEIEITTLASATQLNYGPYNTGTSELTGINDSYSNLLGMYAVNYSVAEVSRLNLPVDFEVGVCSLKLGGTVNLADFVAENSAILTGIEYTIGTSVPGINSGPIPTPSPITNLVTSYTATVNSETEGVVLQQFFDSIYSRGAVMVEPALDPCSECNMKFTIKKGTVWPGEYSIVDKCTSTQIKNPTVKVDPCDEDAVDDSQFFEDWVFDTERYALTEPTEFFRYANDNLPVICIDAKEKLTLSFTVISSLVVVNANPAGSITTPTNAQLAQQQALSNALTDFQAENLSLYFPSGFGTGFDVENLTGNANYINVGIVGLGTAPSIVTATDRTSNLFGNTTVIPRYSSWPAQFTTNIGMKFPGSMIIPANSSIISSTNQNAGVVTSTVEDVARAAAAQSRLFFEYAIVPDGFVFQGSYIFEEVVPNNTKISFPVGSILTNPAEVPLSASWKSFPINDADIAAGHVLVSDLKFKCSQILTGDVSLSCGSLIKRGSILAPGPATPTLQNPAFITGKGMVSTKDTKVVAGTEIQADYEVCKQGTTCAGASFLAGTVFKKLSSLPAGFFITNGNTAPGDITIATNAGITLNPGLELNKPILGSGFTWNIGTGFEPCSEIPGNSIISQGVVFPSGTKISCGTKFPFPFPNPAGYVYQTSKPIPAGTEFAPGTVLPEVFARPNLVPAPIGSAVGQTPQKDVPYYFIYAGSTSYFVVKSGTVLAKGCSLPQGTVLLATQNMAALADYTTGTPTFSAAAYTPGTGVVPGIFVTPTSNPPTLSFQETDYNFAYCQGPAGIDFTLTAGVESTNGINLLVQTVLPNDLAIPIGDSQTILKGFIFNVPFVIQQASPIVCEYVVTQENRVYHPENKELLYDVVLNTDFTVPEQFTLVRRVVLPSYPSCFITTLIPTATAFIRFPNNTTTTNRKFKVGSEGLRIATTPLISEVVSRASISLRLGNKIDVSNATALQNDNALYLTTLLQLPCDWKILADISSVVAPAPEPYTVPAITLTGYFLPAGAKLPISITVNAGDVLPAGLVTSNPIQLEEDYVVPPCSSPLLIKAGSKILERSCFQRGTVLVGGLNASGLVYGKVECWNAEGELSLSPGDALPESFQYNVFYGDLGLVVHQSGVDVDQLLLRIADLEAKVLTLSVAHQVEHP